MVKHLFFNNHCTQIVSQFVVLDMFPHFYFVARGWFRALASSRMRIFWGNSWRLASTHCCNKEPLLEVWGGPDSAFRCVCLFMQNKRCLLYSHVKGNCAISTTVHIRFWFGWREQMLSLLTSFKSKAKFCVVKVAPLSVWYYLIVFLIGFLILFCYLLNCITWLTLPPFSIPCQFLVSVCQSKGLFKVNSKFFKAESKVCLVK